MRRESKWTQIYWGAAEGRTGLYPYVRLVPSFMHLENAGAHHGIQIDGPCANEEEAIKFADYLDRFFERMIEELPKK